MPNNKTQQPFLNTPQLTAMENNTALIDQMVGFVNSIGIPVAFGKIPKEKEFVPGICIQDGGLLIDRDNLLYPGDILHEAGHIAVTPSEERSNLDGVLETNTTKSATEEMMAIAWSYAAALHLSIDPHIVFHEHGYKGGGASLVDNFSEGRYIAVPMLEWVGMTADKKKAAENGLAPYPHMISWIR